MHPRKFALIALLVLIAQSPANNKVALMSDASLGHAKLHRHFRLLTQY
jgi:hypothetical protein